MLLGQHDAKIDEKGRISLPSRFKKDIGDKVIITLGYEKSLIAVSEQTWKTLLSGTEGRPFIEYETRETQRFLLGGASFIELDNKGRFILPGYLREFAGIKTEVVFLGLSNYVELWDKSVWEEYRAHLEKNIERISERLADKNREDKKK